MGTMRKRGGSTIMATMSDPFPFRVFEPEEEVLVVERKLPHWPQPGTISFITFRTYELTDYIVMPNHVHLLAAFPDSPAMLDQCESCKRFTATRINRQLNRKGRFWQHDGFDHLVRSVEQFEYLRGYIAQNPIKARLKHSECRHKSKVLWYSSRSA